ncbi:hypothetical protein [Sporosarcina sp. P17b]|uniref:hypothetical protein n=1 Tax=Sporosarcina sp. P17b TaxID=2048260 RepID=UPI000C166BEC|nr:hypothetical protein [Sporosarcina sp. P17b]PIC72418.1 hypothetical protein CSV76_15350 [Sporosarcina sp. P17b]
MEKQLKKIADELQLIRKEMQRNNRTAKIENTVMMQGEALFSEEETIERITKKIIEKLKQI